MENVIKDCYFSIFNTNPSEKVTKEIKNNLPACVVYMADTFGANNNEVKDITYLFIHSNYKNKKCHANS